MKNYCVSVLVMMILSTVIVSTANAIENKHRFTAKPQIKHKIKSLTFRRKPSLKNVKETIPENTALHKSLDLAFPPNNFKETDVRRHINGVQETVDNAFFDDSRKKQDTLQVKGQFVMSQEPEADKKKSADGAGITINLRR